VSSICRGIIVSNLAVKEVCGPAALLSLKSEWQSLFAATKASPFLSWEWLSSWHQWLGPDRQPRLFCAREGAKLVGLLPLCEEARRLKGLFTRVRRLSFLGEQLGGSDYLDVVALPGYEQECANLLFSHLAERVEFDLLEFDGIASDSPSLPWLALHFSGKDSFKYRLEPRYICPQLRLNGSAKAFLQTSPRASHFNRCLRRLSRMPEFEYRVIKDCGHTPDAFERFLMLHEQLWARRGGSGATGHQVLKNFQRDVVAKLAQAGRLHFEEIWIDGACRASLYGIDAGDRYYYYLSGYDPAWAKYSLGFSLIGLSITGAAERGMKFYDLLRGAEKYKFDWADEARATVTVQIASNTLPARFATLSGYAVEIAHAAALTLLPDRTLALWRRWRQNRAHHAMPATPEANSNDGSPPQNLKEGKAAGLATNLLVPMAMLF
jgi:CelD/BcsL family acetyltransferase involved in cellulose biosynthesis